MKNKILSFDVGGTYIKFARVHKDCTIENLEKIKTPNNRDSFYLKVCDIIEKQARDIEIISFSFPGFIDTKNGILVTAGALIYMEEEHFVVELEKRTGKRVFVFNDAKSAAISEMVTGNARGTRNYVCITIGTGIGGAIVSNGQLLNGHDFAAGEIGFTTPTYKDEKSFSSYCGIMSLREAYAKKNNVDFEYVSGEDALSDQEIKLEFMNVLSAQIMNLVYILNPEKVLIGGAISGDQEFISLLRKVVYQKNVVQKINFQLEACKNENNAGVIGAAYLAFESIKN